LVLALIFVVIVGVVVTVLTSLAGTNLLDTSALQGQRAVEYAGDSAIDTAIQGIRYTSSGRSSATCAQTTTGNFPASGTPIALTEDVTNLTIYVVWTSPGPQCVNIGTTNGSSTISGPANTFSALDVGQAVQGFGVPLGATISSVQNDTQATLSAKATHTGSASVTITTPPDQRLVVFNACTSAAACPNSPIVRAVVRFNDLKSDGVTPDQGLAVTVQNWLVQSANA
jgi:hypothetical protein